MTVGLTRADVLRRGGAAALGVTALGALARGATAARSAGTVNIVTTSSTDYYMKEILVPLFEQQTGISVNYSGIAFADLPVRFSTIVASHDSSADLLYGYLNPLRSFRGQLFSDISSDLARDLKKYPPFALQTMGSGKAVYGIPTLTVALVTLYRTDLFKKAGVGSFPRTWTDAIEQLKKVMDVGKIAGIEIALGSPDTAWNLFTCFVNGAGAQVFSPDYKRILIESPAGLRALQTLADLGASGVLSPNSYTIAQVEEANKHFAAGGLAALISAAIYYPSFQDPKASNVVGKTGAALNPGITKRTGTFAGSEGLALSKYAANRDDALKFLSFLTTNSAVVAAAKAGVITAQPAVRNNPVFSAKNPTLKVDSAALAQGGTIWVAPWGSKANPKVQPILINVAKGKTTPEKGLKEIAKVMKKAAAA